MGTNNNDVEVSKSGNDEKKHESDNVLEEKKIDSSTQIHIADQNFQLQSRALELQESKSIRDDTFRKEELKDRHETDMAALDSINKGREQTNAQFDHIMKTPLAQLR